MTRMNGLAYLKNRTKLIILVFSLLMILSILIFLILPRPAAAVELGTEEVFSEGGEIPAAEAGTETEEAAELGEVDASDGDGLAEWTVMLYLCGADLESNERMATNNLAAVARTAPVPEVNFIIETGGAKEWHSQELGMEVDPSRLERWSYTDQGFTKVGEAELASLAEKSTLEDFLTWTAEHYPAKKYQLLLWDHGGGSIKGVVFDELYGDSSLQLYDIADALEDSGVHLENFMTDTCLMATLETAEAVAPYAEYYVGCEETLSSYGSNYTGFLQYLYDYPECDGAQLGKKVCSSSEQMYSDLGGEADLGFFTMSLIDLSKVSGVREAFDNYICEVESLLDDPAAFYEYCYATRNRETYAYSYYADIYDLAGLASGHGVSRKTAAELQNAVEDAVLYNATGRNHVRSHGMTVMYSFNEEPFTLDHFSRVCSDPIYLAFLDRLSYKWKAPEWVYETVTHQPDISLDDYNVNATFYASEDGMSAFLEMPAEDNFIIEGSWELLRHEPTVDIWQYYGKSPFVHEEHAEDTLRWFTTFDGTWPTFGNVPLNMNLIDEQETYILFTTPMKVDDRADNIRIMYRLDEETPQYRIIGSSSLDDHTGYPDRNTLPLMSGSIVEPLATLMDVDNDTSMNCKTTEPFTYSEQMTVTNETLEPGTYAVRYVTTDILGNKHNTDLINCEWDGETLRYGS